MVTFWWYAAATLACVALASTAWGGSPPAQYVTHGSYPAPVVVWKDVTPGDPVWPRVVALLMVGVLSYAFGVATGWLARAAKGCNPELESEETRDEV